MANTNKLIRIHCLALLSAGIAALVVPAELNAQARVLKSGARVNDVLSKETVAQGYFNDRKTLVVVLLGDRAVFEYKDGRALNVAYFNPPEKSPDQIGFTTCGWIITDFLEDFKNRKELVGQANLSLRINDDKTCEIVTKTIYVPGCEPFTGNTASDPRLQEFWTQVKSSVAAIESEHLRLGKPEYKSMTVELVVGRDPLMFPRYATPFNGIVLRDHTSKIRKNVPCMRHDVNN